MQALLIDAAIPRLEDEANLLLRRMTDGRMSLKLTNVLWVDETVSARARIREETPEGDRTRVHCDGWVEKDAGTRVALGSASATRPPAA